MSRGDELREKFGANALALLAASRINARRPEDDPRSFPGKSFVLRQLKHPEEIYRLRSIYEDGLHILGLYSPVSERKNELRFTYGMSEDEAQRLIELDEYERPEFGQRFRDTFHLSDTFFAVSRADMPKLNEQLTRFLDLLFGSGVITPTKDEYAMNLAQSAALRSGSLARQVGASILDQGGDVLAVGSNEVPQFGGGPYWERDPVRELSPDYVDRRDHVVGYDSNDAMQRGLLMEVLAETDPKWSGYSAGEREKRVIQICKQLKTSGARIMNLTEFGRAVHAEMSALLAAARVGTSVKGSTLFVTTFPCHGCTKHIIDAGIRRVVYIEPYPKSLARDLHDDAISVEDSSDRGKVSFEPFIGVAPRRYADLFSMKSKEGREARRKDHLGNLEKGSSGLRLSMQPLTYIDREELAAKLLNKKMEGPGLFPENGGEDDGDKN